MVGSVGNLLQAAEIQRRIDELDVILSGTLQRPEWFADPAEARAWIEEEIMQLEAEQLTIMENSRLAGRLNLEAKSNLIIPSIPQWRAEDKGETEHESR